VVSSSKLSLVVSLTFVLFANAVRYATGGVMAWVGGMLTTWRQARADERLWNCAVRDPRVMNEILRAKGREADFVDEPRAHIYAPRPAAEPVRLPPAPMFSRYYEEGNVDQVATTAHYFAAWCSQSSCTRTYTPTPARHALRSASVSLT
jgi:hypothetical protein